MHKINSFGESLSLSILLIMTTQALVGVCSFSKCHQMMEDGGQALLFCQLSVSHLPLPSTEMISNLTKLRILGTRPDSRHSGTLGPGNLTGLESLTYLQLNNFGLVRIEAETFRGMQRLKKLDLSHNHITFIQPGAFNGLVLDLLSLSDNPKLNLGHGTFHGSKVHHFAARNCDLRHLAYEVVAEAKPKQLSLSKNQLTWLDPLFENLVKPWSSLVPTISLGSGSSTAVDENYKTWGYIDLSENPLDCSCQLMWLSKMIEKQLYHSQRSTLQGKETSDEVAHVRTARSVGANSNRLMHHFNLTCASPAQMAGQRLPRSWTYFCPMPQVIGIDVDLLTHTADVAQLTCIGRGQPAPSLAWTYRIQGQKVQRSLDPPAPLRSGSQSSYSSSGYSQNSDSRQMMVERRFSLNVSLENAIPKNFTCTVWNDDSHVPDHFASDISRRISHYDQTDRYKADGPMHMSGREALAPTSSRNLRMHEVTIRISGPAASSSTLPPILTTIPIVNNTKETEKSGRLVKAESERYTFTTPRMEPQGLDPVAGHSVDSAGYTYLFDKRFTLLQLLGAVLGTFFFTLFLLLLVTRFCSCFCQLPQLPAKKFNTSRFKSRTNWCSWWRKSENRVVRAPLHGGDLGGVQVAADHAHLIESKPTLESVFKAGANFNGYDPNSTHSAALLQCWDLPQAYLLTGVSMPGMARCSTPPPNPTYWPMPEYTYTGGNGSHEYDVPRPIEPMSLTTKSFGLTNPHTQVLLSQRPLPAIGGAQFQPSSLGTCGQVNLFHTVSAIPTNPWRGQLNAGGGPQQPAPMLTTLGSLGGSRGQTLPDSRHPQHQQYGQYPTGEGHLPVVYSGDYPTYLQTRPYPQYPSQSQPLLEMVTASTGIVVKGNGGGGGGGADTADTGLGSIATEGGLSKDGRRGSGPHGDDDYTPNTNLSVTESDT